MIEGIVGLTRGKDGTVYVTTKDHCVAELSKDLELTILAGQTNSVLLQDGVGQDASFHNPR